MRSTPSFRGAWRGRVWMCAVAFGACTGEIAPEPRPFEDGPAELTPGGDPARGPRPRRRPAAPRRPRRRRLSPRLLPAPAAPAPAPRPACAA
jgi:hypothetical protein